MSEINTRYPSQCSYRSERKREWFYSKKFICKLPLKEECSRRLDLGSMRLCDVKTEKKR